MEQSWGTNSLQKIALTHRSSFAKIKWPLVWTRKSKCRDFGMSENWICAVSLVGTVYIYSLEGQLIHEWKLCIEYRQRMVVHQDKIWILKCVSALVEIYSKDGRLLDKWSLFQDKTSIKTDRYEWEMQISQSQLFALNRSYDFFRVFDLKGQFLYDIPYRRNGKCVTEFAVSVTDSKTRVYLIDHVESTVTILENDN